MQNGILNAECKIADETFTYVILNEMRNLLISVECEEWSVELRVTSVRLYYDEILYPCHSEQREESFSTTYQPTNSTSEEFYKSHH